MDNKYFSSADFYRFDHYTINEIGIPSAVLMERAAFAVYNELITKIDAEDKILIIAGTGNNGGDAVALARMLYLENYKVQLYITTRNNFSAGMKLQMNIAQNIELPMTFESDSVHYGAASVIVDGIFGIGLSREISGEYKKIIAAINNRGKNNCLIISLDVPSGFSAIDGTIFDTIVHADWTYTFGYRKIGMDNIDFKDVLGEVIVCKIGYPEKILKNKFFPND